MKPRRAYYSRGPKDCRLEAFHSRNQPASADHKIIHWHTQMHVYYLEKGSIEIFSLSGNTVLSPGDLYIIPPEEVHGVRVCRAGTDYSDILFSLELITVPEGHFFHTGFIKPLREGLLRLPRMLSPDQEGYEAVKKHFLSIVQYDTKHADYKSHVFMEALAMCLKLMPLCRIAKDGEPNPLSGVRGNDAINICTVYIGRNYMKPITLQELAELVHLHPNYLCRLFKEYCGQTIFEYIASIRVSFATQFIRRYDKPLQEIAESCGFNSMSYFVRKFKQHMGMTPYAYSKLYKNR